MEWVVLIRDAEVDGRRICVRFENGRLAAWAPELGREAGEEVIDARGGALLPGLHDQHLHLFSLAADFASVSCGPPAVESRTDLAEALSSARPEDGWIRGTGYFESVAGPLDRDRLDTFRADHPVRIQHRSGSMWFLNSRAIETIGLDAAHAEEPEGVERDPAGRATGRLFRADPWLRERLPRTSPPCLTRVGSFLARCGVTRVTDATPSNTHAEAALFRSAQRSGELPQSLRMMGDLTLDSAQRSKDPHANERDHAAGSFEVAEYKILLDEPALPDFESITANIVAAHASGRAVALHTVTRTEIHFAIAALDAAGVRVGDRLEHASIAPPESIAAARRLGLKIVTQPNFVFERGDAYREHVDASDLPDLYRVRSWLAAGVLLAAGTDAPFGDPDPWCAMRAAVTRKTRSGQSLGGDESVSPETALGLFTGPALRPGGEADCCLLDTPWAEAREGLSRDRVVATIRSGRAIWRAGD